MLEPIFRSAGGYSIEEETPCAVRSWTTRDASAVARLAHDGLLPDQIESGAIAVPRLPQAYLFNDREHFWVAELDHQVIGTIALAEVDRDIAQVQWLRVAPLWQPPRRIIPSLMRAAVNHAREFGYLKLLLDIPLFAQARAIAHLHALGYEFSRNHRVAGRNRAEFYANLYDRQK